MASLTSAAAGYWRIATGFDRNVRLLFVSKALLWLSGYGMFVVLFNLYLLRLGYGPEFIGMVNAAGLGAEAIAALPASEIGRRWGSRRAMIIGDAGSCLAFVLLALAWLVPQPWQPGWLLATCALSSVGFAVFLVNMTPFLMASTRPEESTHAFSIFSAVTTGSGFLGAMVGGLLPGLCASVLHTTTATPAPYGIPLVLAALLLVPSTLVIIQAREPAWEPAPDTPTTDAAATVSQTATEPTGGTGRLPILLIVVMSLAMLVRTLGDGTANIFFNVYLDAGLHVPTALIGTIAAIGQLLAMPAALATPLLSSRWGNPRTYVIATLGVALSLLPLALLPRWEAAAIGYIGVMTLLYVVAPSITVFQLSLVTPKWRATMSGATSMAFTLGWAVTGLGGGYIISHAGYRALFLAGAGLVAAGALLFWAYFRVPRGELAAALRQAPTVPGAQDRDCCPVAPA